MIQVEYILGGVSGELQLLELNGFESKGEVLESIESSEFELTVLEDSLKVLKPELDTTPEIFAQDRGKRNPPYSAKSEAERFGFSKFRASIDDRVITIV